MRGWFILALFCYTWYGNAQYIPQGWNYGLGAVANIGEQQQFGFSPRVEYAPTCYTSYLLAYDYYFSLTNPQKEGVHELSFGVNTILFNFEPTYITVGLGYMVNTSTAFEEMQKEALLFFTSGAINHGLQMKLRALIRISLPMHFFMELNVKSLGRYYDTVAIGLLYDFDLN